MLEYNINNKVVINPEDAAPTKQEYSGIVPFFQKEVKDKLDS